MSEQAQGQGTSGQTDAPQKPKAKGNQLEGKRSDALSTTAAADIFKGSILGDTAKSDKSADDKAPPAKPTKPKSPKNPKGQSEETEANDETEGDEAEPGQSSDEEEPEGHPDAIGDEADDGEVDADGEQTADDADQAEDLHTVLVNGKEVQIPYEELVSGYQRQADYTAKTTELAQERAKLQSEKEQLADLPQVKEAYQKEAGRFHQNAELVMVALEKGFLPPEPSEELRNTDPSAYIAAKEKRQEGLQFMAGLKQEVAKIQHQKQVEHQQAVQKGRVTLLEVQPELQKPEVRTKFQQYVVGLGYTEEQIRGEADHRLFDLAFKAMKWDDLVARSKNPAPNKPRPKVISQTNARDDKETVVQKKKSETVNAHKRNHSVKSATDVIAQRIIDSRKTR